MRMLLLNAVIAIYAQLDGAASAPCLSDKELARIAGEGKRHLELERHSVTTHSEATRLPFDFSFAPANYTNSGVNPSSRYIVPRLGPWAEGDLGGESFLNWGIGEVTPMTSRKAMVVVMCTPPPVRMWSLELAILYRLNLTESIHHNISLQAGAPISNTENSATVAAAARETAPLLVIVTADRNTDAAVRGAFSRAGLPSMNVATIVINGTSSLLNFGTQPIAEGCDLFQLCMRVHPSPSQAVADGFQEYLGRRFPLLMVEPSFPAADSPLYPIADRRMRHGVTTEAGLEQRRAVLEKAVVERMRQAAGLQLHSHVTFAPVELDKRRCLLDSDYKPYRVSAGCFGTSSDGRYTLSDSYTLPQGTAKQGGGENLTSLVIVVIGANHAATGNAADNQLLYEKTVVVNPEGLKGSAEHYLGSAATPADAGLFAYAFSAKCAASATGGFCSTIAPQQAGAAGPLLRLEAYLDTKSGTRPSMELVHPLALVFKAAA